MEKFRIGQRVRVELSRDCAEGNYGDYYHEDIGTVVGLSDDRAVRVDFDEVEDKNWRARRGYLVMRSEIVPFAMLPVELLFS